MLSAQRQTIPRWLSLALIVVIFAIAFVYARMQGPVDQVDELTETAEHLLEAEPINDVGRRGPSGPRAR